MHGLNLVLVVVYQIVVIIAIVQVLMDNRQPAKTMAWALVIWFVPVIGILFYIFFGRNTRRERLVSQRSLDQLSKRSMLGFVEQHDLHLPTEHKPVIDLFISQSFSLPFQANQVAIYRNGYEFFPALLAAIARAKSHIHIDIYIFQDDALGQLVADALIEKAHQGVEVRIVYDDVGCWKVRRGFFERMREEGIEVMPFLPVNFPSFTSKVNYRNHRKLIVIDGQTGFIGGMNIALRYVKGVGGQSWRDTMVQIEGSGVYALQRAFLVDWYFVDRTLISDRKYYPELSQRQLAGGAPCALLQVVTSGPVMPYPEIMQGFVRIIMAARRYVYIETPYFLPTEPVLFALKTAALAGIDIRILVPQTNDTWFSEWASRSYLREAAEAGIKVGLYTPGFLHSKLMVCDDSISTCGSANVDFRSFENNFEANVFLYDEGIARQMKQLFLDDEAESVQFASLSERARPRFHVRLWESLVRLLSPLM